MIVFPEIEKPGGRVVGEGTPPCIHENKTPPTKVNVVRPIKMAVDNSEIIDFISITEQNIVVLTISDHLDWEDINSHLILLQDKINSYLKFIESGEIYETYPKAKGKSLVIEIVKKYSLSKEGENFINFAKKIVNNAGIGLESVYLEYQ